MKRAFLSFAVAIMSMVAIASDADLLIWEIDLDGNKNGLEGTGFSSISQFFLRSLTDPLQTISLGKYSYKDVPFTSANSDPTFSSGIGEWTQGNGQTENVYFLDMGSLLRDNNITSADYDSYEFIMQLANNDGAGIMWSEHFTDSSKTPLYLSTVINSGLYDSEKIGNMLNPEFDFLSVSFNFGSHLVPEPTSGLLMMLGAGLLALRRRRRA